MPLSRRTLLGASTLALAACRAEQPASVEPRLVGQSPERGHLLRSAELLDSPITEQRKAAVVIVGGGAAGLCAAYHLRRAGIDDIELLELEPELGGTARSGVLPRSAHPMGAHYLPTPPPDCSELLELLAELRLLVGRHRGVPEYKSTAICPAPIERHFFQGTWHPGLYPFAGESASEAEQAERFWARLHELDRARDEHGQRLFRLPVRRSSARMRELDRMSMAAWLDQNGFNSWRLRWYVDYACRDDYGCTIEQTSAFAGLHHFLARGLDDDDHERELLTWPGGNGELLTLLREHVGLGERLRRDHLVYAIDPDRGQLRVRDLLGQRSVAIEAQAILWAAPRFLLAHVLPLGRDPVPAGALSYALWLVANLELREPPGGVGAALAWDNVPIIEDPRARNLGYVVATHTQDRLAAYQPGCVITYYEPLPADDAEGLANARAHLLGSDARSLAEQVLRSLERMHPSIRKQLTHLHVHRWGHAMLRPTPGLLFGEALARARQPIGRVCPCAADVGGLPLFEEAFYAALTGADWAATQLR